MLNIEEVRALGQATDTTWGHSSAERKLTSKLNGDVLELQYMTIVHFAGERALSQQLESCRDEANQIFTDGLKKIKKQFKESIDRALTAKELQRDDDVELISATSNSPRKIAYFRSWVRLQVS